jgi:glycosyltransferase involved in cell wall biosynthesis
MDSERFKLLVLTPAFPYPPVSGGDIRIFHLLRRLSSTFSVHLFSYTGGPSERLIEETQITAVHARDPADARVHSWHPRQWIKFWRHAPHGLSLDVDPDYAQALRRVIARTGVHGILIDHLYMMQYARFVGTLPVFYSATDVETTKFARWYDGEHLSSGRRLLHWAQRRVIGWHESKVGKRARVTFATSALDRDTLLRINRTGRFVVVANGVDLSYFRPRRRESFSKPPRVFFVGTMFYRPNYLAARFLAHEVFPLIRRDVPDATCHLAGKTNDRDYSDLHRPEAGVYMHGFVKDVRPHFEESQILVVPLSVGSGTRIKILEAMATGTPVVSTAIGAEGLECSHGENILIANSASDLAAAGVRLLRDREECFRMGEAGRHLVERKYSWDASADVMRSEIARALEQEYESPASAAS